MTKFAVILKHFPLKKRERKTIKKVILKTEKNGKKKKNSNAYENAKA